MKKYVIKSFILLMMIFMLVSCRDSANNVTESVNETATETPIFTKGEQEIFYEFYDYLLPMANEMNNFSYEIISNNTTLEVNMTFLIATDDYSIGDIKQLKVTKVNGKYVFTENLNGTLKNELTADSIVEVLFTNL